MSGPDPGLGWPGLVETAGSGPSGSSAHPEEPERSSGDARDSNKRHMHLLAFICF